MHASKTRKSEGDRYEAETSITFRAGGLCLWRDFLNVGVYFHRFNVSFSPSIMKRDPTKGRSLDHIGFEVKNLDEFAKRLEGLGMKLDSPSQQLPDSKMRVAFLTDPWGTFIELTENLSPSVK